MAHNARRVRKKRGSRTHGYGNTQKHRGSGSHGGVGMAGSKKQRWSYVSKYLPNYFGHRGFKRPKNLVKKIKAINVGDLEKNIGYYIKEKKAELKDNRYFIDLKKLGYDKLLGAGEIKQPMLIKVEACSQLAAKKIEEAGGKIETITQ